jgi:hypothetical protein
VGRAREGILIEGEEREDKNEKNLTSLRRSIIDIHSISEVNNSVTDIT